MKIDDLPPPVLIPPDVVFEAIGWFIQCHMPEYASVKLRQIWTKDGIVLEPVSEAQSAKERQ